mmetsp:Transcript_4953/g.12445  ORF Transcript_4953/g.12445 Transcript_4953/m.12445 type:complete len:85 (+) Transcript_4953:59-313(+)
MTFFKMTCFTNRIAKHFVYEQIQRLQKRTGPLLLSPSPIRCVSTFLHQVSSNRWRTGIMISAKPENTSLYKRHALSRSHPPFTA